MIFLYTSVLLLFAALRVVIAFRAASLERKYSTVAGAVLKEANQPAYKPGNGGKVDFGASAKRILELGLQVRKRDILESKCIAWRGWADKLGRVVAAMRTWKGSKLPYSMGVLDVWLALYVIDRLGVGDMVSPRRVVDNVVAWLGW